MNPEMETQPARLRLATKVNRMVLRDAPKDEVFEELAVNGITGNAAAEMYQSAVRNRVKVIRAKLGLKVLRNLPWLIVVWVFVGVQWGVLGSVSVFRISTLIVSMLTNIFFIPAFIGLWKIINNLLWAVFAAHKKGSFDDDEA